MQMVGSGVGGGESTTPLNPKLDLWPSHGPAYQAQTAGEATAYIGTHLIYVALFIFLVVLISWTVGEKGAFWFLVLVLLGQLLSNATEIQSLLPTKG